MKKTTVTNKQSSSLLSATLRSKYDADVRTGGKLPYPEAQHHIRAVATRLKDEIAAWLGAGNATTTSKSELASLTALMRRCERDIARNDPDKVKPPTEKQKEKIAVQPATPFSPCNYAKLDQYYLTLIVRDDPTAAAVMLQWMKEYYAEKQRMQASSRGRAAVTSVVQELFTETNGRLLDSMRGIMAIMTDPANEGKFSDKMQEVVEHQIEQLEKEEL